MRSLRDWLTHLLTFWHHECPQGRSIPPSRPRRYQGGAKRFLHLEVLESRTLPSVVAGDGLTGQYFADQNLTTWRLTRTDPSVNYSWAAGQSPATNVSGDHFSMR